MQVFFFGTKLITQVKLVVAQSATRSSPAWNILDEDGTRSAVFWLDMMQEDSVILSENNRIEKWNSIVGNYAYKFQNNDSGRPEYRTHTNIKLFNNIYPHAFLHGHGNQGLSVAINPIANDQTFSFAIAHRPFKETNTNDPCPKPNGEITNHLFSMRPSNKNDALRFWFSLRPSLGPNPDGSCIIEMVSGGGSVASNTDGSSQRARYYPGKINSLIVVIDFTNTENNAISYTNGLKILEHMTHDQFFAPKGDLSIGIPDYASIPDYFNHSYKGNIYEVIIFKSALSEAEALSVQKYFMSKYQID